MPIGYENLTYVNITIEEEAEDEEEALVSLYKYGIPFMLILCLISILVNIRVLLSIHWIKRPLSPTLYISLSLAGADLCSSALLCLGLILNSYLPQVYRIESSHNVATGLELYRLSGIVITVIHLLALSVNHWLGILKPLHYTTIVTPGKIKVVTTFLWVLPVVYFNVYFRLASEKNPWQDYAHTTIFLQELKFRVNFSFLLIIPIIMMIVFYGHILYMVRKQQKIWAKLSRSGSKRCTSQIKTNTQQRRTMEGNVKAIYTTLLILGSCVVGWLPAMAIFLLVCNDCFYNSYTFPVQNTTIRFCIGWIANTLIILKTLANPIIYTTRMIEIKEGMHRMHLAMKKAFCSRKGNIHHRDTALCNLNGSLTTKKSVRTTNYQNTPV